MGGTLWYATDTDTFTIKGFRQSRFRQQLFLKVILMHTFHFFTGQLQQQLPLSLHAPHRGQLPDFQRSQILRASD